MPIPPVLRHPEPFEREDQPPLDVSAETSHAYPNPRVFERQMGVDFRDRQLVPTEPVDYHRGGLKEVINLSSNERTSDFPHRDTLWSVARLSLERHDHASVYKDDTPRSYTIGSSSRGKYIIIFFFRVHNMKMNFILFRKSLENLINLKIFQTEKSEHTRIQ